MIAKALRFSAMLATRLGGSGFQFILNVFIGRFMGSGALGLFALPLNWGYVVSATVSFGLPRYTLAEVARPYAEGQRGFVRALVLRSATTSATGSLILLAIGLAAVFVLHSASLLTGTATFSICAALAFGAIYAPCQISADSLKGMRRQNIGVFIDFGLVAFLTLVLSAVAFFAMPGLRRYAVYIAPVALVASAAVTAVISYLTIIGMRGPRRVLDHPLPPLPYRRLLSQWSVYVLLALSARLPYFALPFYVSNSGIGLFTAAFNMTTAATIILYAVSTYFLPSYAQVSRDRAALKAEYHRAQLVSTGVALPVLFAIVIFGHWLLQLYGPSFVAAYPLLIVLTIGQLAPVFLAQPVDFLTVTGMEHQASISIGISFVLSVAAMFLLGHAYGVEGIAWAQAISFSSRSTIAACFCIWSLYARPAAP